MMDLQNVWVCAAGLELVRADRIVTVYADDGNSGFRSSARPWAAGKKGELYLKVLLAGVGGETSGNTVTLGKMARGSDGRVHGRAGQSAVHRDAAGGPGGSVHPPTRRSRGPAWLGNLVHPVRVAGRARRA